MKTDKLVMSRFEELKQKADSILANKKLDFTSDEGVPYYKVDVPAFMAWATSTLSLLQRVFGENSIHYRHFEETYRSDHEYESSMRECNAILQAAQEDYQGGYLFQVRGLIQAEVFDSVLELASELLQSGYKDPACVVAGVALETALKELCTRKSIDLNKLDRMNADLAKAGVYNVGMQNKSLLGQIDAIKQLMANGIHTLLLMLKT
jgi:hypothetical protein